MRNFRKVGALRSKLLGWFRQHRRRLPWRISARAAGGRAQYAYRVWVAEIMLQQTRVAAVLPYYQRFLRRFPGVGALARAPRDEVLRYWAGLGYYTRARNLHRAAKEIVRRHGGCFPGDYAQALALPGIGRYTAAAILSIAYGQPYAVLDGNVARVLARLACLRGDADSASYGKKLEVMAAELLPQVTPGEFNQAMMELGARVCLPRSPLCQQCPLEPHCLARRAGLETVLPGRRRKPARVGVHLAVAIPERAGKVLVVRNQQRFFSSLWQFPSESVAAGSSPHYAVKDILRRCGWRGRIEHRLGTVRHSVTHHDVRLHVFLTRVDGAGRRNGAGARWLRPARLRELPVSSAMKKIVQLYGQHRRAAREKVLE